MISLAMASVYVIGSGPYASRLVLTLKQQLFRKQWHHADAIQFFLDMGFPRDRAEQALSLNK